MNKNILIILAILILPICFYYYIDKTQSVLANKVNSTRPKIIKFSSDMCSECQKMEKTVNQVYPKYSGKIELINIPVQKQTKYNLELIKQYKVTLVPTIIFKKSNGQTMAKIEGAMSNNEFEQYLKRLLNE